MTLYLKYRPNNLEELDLEGVRETLTKIVKSGNLPHAFLFSGPKGTGKTSAARILAKIINCENRRKNSVEPCNKCDQCKSITNGSNLDVIELDAASHRGIDDIRNLKEAVKLSPSRAEKKVYIIDEVHMLTLEASNALLKTLEEPPEHVIFILATTNPEKLIPTIRSRATNVIFTKAGEKEVERQLKRIEKGEKIKIDDEGLKLIAGSSNGDFRNSAKIVEELLLEGKKAIKGQDVVKVLSGGLTDDAERLLSLLKERKTREALLEIEKVINSGLSIDTYLETILQRLRKALLAESGVGDEKLEGFNREDLVSLIKVLTRASIEIKGSFIEQLPLEVCIVEWCKEEESILVEEMDLKPSREKIDKKADSKKTEEKESSKKKLNFQEKIDKGVWNKILKAIRPKNASMEALLRATKPLGIDKNTLNLAVFYKFHKERLEEFHHRVILEEVINEIFGRQLKITCTLTEPPKKKIEKVEDEEKIILTEGEDKDIIKVAEEVFGN